MHSQLWPFHWQSFTQVATTNKKTSTKSTNWKQIVTRRKIRVGLSISTENTDVENDREFLEYDYENNNETLQRYTVLWDTVCSYRDPVSQCMARRRLHCHHWSVLWSNCSKYRSFVVSPAHQLRSAFCTKCPDHNNSNGQSRNIYFISPAKL